MLYQSKISFLEKAVSKDERLIAGVVKELFDSIVRHDLTLLLSLFSDDAKIYSTIANDFISKDQYAKHIQLIWSQIVTLQFYGLLFRIMDGKAIVSGFSRYVYINGTSKTWRREIKLYKNQNSWLITESGLYPL